LQLPADKENINPVLAAKKLKASISSILELVDYTKANIRKIPAKWPFEELLYDLQWCIFLIYPAFSIL